MWPTIIGLMFGVAVQRWIVWPTLNHIYSVLYMHLWDKSNRKLVCGGGEHVNNLQGFKIVLPLQSTSHVSTSFFIFVYTRDLLDQLPLMVTCFILSFLTHIHSCSMKR